MNERWISVLVMSVLASGVGSARAGEDCGLTFSSHDETFENAYTWVYSGCEAPDRGAFAEAFVGSVNLCSVSFHLAQNGNQAGQTMNVFVWEDDGTGRPGELVASVLDVDPGPLPMWPETQVVTVPVDVDVHNRWWVGWWGNWPGEEAGWLQAADENGAGGMPRTNIATGIGYPSGWEHPSLVIAWSGARSLGIEAQATGILGVADAAPPPVLLGAPTPNPFRGHSSLSFELVAPSGVGVTVHDVSGRLVRTLASGGHPAGVHTVTWDGTDARGVRSAPGVYFVRIRTGAGAGGTARRVVLTD